MIISRCSNIDIRVVTKNITVHRCTGVSLQSLVLIKIIRSVIKRLGPNMTSLYYPLIQPKHCLKFIQGIKIIHSVIKRLGPNMASLYYPLILPKYCLKFIHSRDKHIHTVIKRLGPNNEKSKACIAHSCY